MQYDRRNLQAVGPGLETIEKEARVLETDKLDRLVRNTTLYLIVYEILLLLTGILMAQVVPADQLLILIILVLGLAILGLVLVPIRGRMVEIAYTKRMLILQKNYLDTLSEAADKQMSYGTQQRREAIAPLTRLIEAQTTIQRDQMSKLQTAEHELASIESALTSLGKKRLLNL